jgi:NADH:ubiquinone oxidoreductase subunit 5 (subunit L)/multisubunit Na+/H+ antiporter MnhA subunit
MDVCGNLARAHLLLWIVPAVCAIFTSALGRRLSHRALSGLSLVGAILPVAQSAAAAVFFLWGPQAGNLGRVEIGFMTRDPFSLVFELTPLGTWAMLLCSILVLAAQIHAIGSVARLVGRHRYQALVLTVGAAGGVLFTAASMVTLLFGWESLALASAFLAGFWESEQGGGRTGMRWLLFQRVSGLLLLLGLLALQTYSTLAAIFVAAAALVRLGQLPFHGWIPDSSRAPSSAMALLHGAASLLAGIFVLDRIWPLFSQVESMALVTGIVGASGVVFGILAGLQQHRPQKMLGWLFLLTGGFCLMGYSVGDPVAARLLVSGNMLVLGGLVLAVGTFAGPLFETESGPSVAKSPHTRKAYLILVAALALPPSLTFVALGRFCGSVPSGTIGLLIRVLVCLAMLTCGWILRRVYSELASKDPDGKKPAGRWAGAAPGGLGVTAFVFGLAAFFSHHESEYLYGGSVGFYWALGSAAALLAGWLLGTAVAVPGRVGKRHWTDRLTNSQLIMDKIAGTGLGVGEMVARLPVIILRALGVVFWRGIGDFIIDTLIMGTTVRTIEGIGTAMRYIQNGRVQRYMFVLVLATLLLVLAMLR